MGLQLFLMSFKSRGPKLILGCFLLLSSLLCITIAIYQTKNYSLYRYFDPLFMSLLLVMQPLYYMYTLSLTSKKFSFRKFAWHLTPALLIFFASGVVYLNLNYNEQIYYLTKYMNGIFIENNRLQTIYVIFHISKFIYLIQVITYFILIIKVISAYQIEFNNMFSSDNDLKLNWLFLFTLFYFIVSVNSVVINFIPTQTLNTQESVLGISMLVFCLFYFVVGYMGMQQRAVIQIINKLDEEVSGFNKTVNTTIIEVLNKYINTEKAFLNPDLRIWDVCMKINSNRTYISNTINKVYQMNFNDYINKLRVEEVCKLIRENSSNYTFDALSSACGFKSISSFNRAFKKFIKMTPSQYKESLQTDNTSEV